MGCRLHFPFHFTVPILSISVMLFLHAYCRYFWRDHAPARATGIRTFPPVTAVPGHLGGGEANVAVALAAFGAPARYITVLPPNNPIVDAFIGELRRFGVDPAHRTTKGRLGIYSVEAGANQRKLLQVVYDRDGQRHRVGQAR